MQNLIIKNGIVFRPDNSFKIGDVAIQNELFTDNFNFQNAKIIDSENLYIIPGLTDIHFHGCMGHDFCEGNEEAFKIILDYEKSVGVTTICPATMTLPEKNLIEIMKAAKKFHEKFPEFIGIDLEGPFISKEKKGAQNEKYIKKPDIDLLNKLNDESGNLIKIVAIAPELENSMNFIEKTSKKFIISLAHTNADYKTAKKAFELGIKHVTHLYNAMNSIKHREPGPVIAAAENNNVDVELICDGIHVHPAVIRNTIKLFSPERIIFISDSMEATGMPDGNYELGGQPVIKKGNKAVLNDGITIAGSVTNLMDCMRNTVLKMGIPLEIAVRCSTVNPSKSIGIYETSGSIENGKIANLVALDKNLNIVFVISRGKIIFS